MFLHRATLAALLLGLGGCLGKTPPARFYLLEPVPSPVRAAEPAQSGTVVAVGPVRIAHYLDRPQLVTATGRNAYQVDDFHRWAERLDENIARVLVRNLSALAPVEQVLLGIPDAAQKVDLRLTVQVLEFHVDAAGQALLTAQWSLRRDKQTLLGKTTTLHAPASNTDPPRMVAALNGLLDEFSRVLAGAIRDVSAANQP